jgi:alpha-L-rhamnosidase
VIKPAPGGKLTWAETTYNSIHGIIGTGWKIEKDKLLLAVAIPANTTALVYVPASSEDAVKEGSKAAKDAEGVKFVNMENGNAVFEVESGTYHFVSAMTK